MPNHSMTLKPYSANIQMFKLAFVAVFTFLASPPPQALAYNSSGFPAVSINKNESFLIVSEAKSIIKSGSKYIRIPTVSSKTPYRASADLTDFETNNTYVACMGSNAFVYREQDQRLIKRELDSANIACAVNSSSEVLFYLKDKNQLVLDDKIIEDIPKLISWQSSGHEFLGLSTNGQIYSLKEGIFKPVPNLKISTTDDYSSFAVKDNKLLFANSSGVSLYDLSDRNNITSERLPVSPCEDKQVCGVSIGHDGSWMVSGYWGTWIGRGKNSLRLKVVQISREFGGTGLGHIGYGKKFLLVSYDDVDLGTLPEEPTVNSLTGERSDDPARYLLSKNYGVYVVWSKVPQENYLLRYKITKLKPSDPQRFVYVHTFKGDIPKKIPKSWLNFERVYRFQAKELTGQLGREPNVELKKNPRRELSPTPDGFYDSQWWHAEFGFDYVRETVSQNLTAFPTIGIVDSGVELNHDEFSHLTPSELKAFDFVEEDETPNDQNGHGTHVAGLIAGKSSGVLPQAKLIIAKALGNKGSSNSLDLARAIVWSVDQGAEILNFSWGGGFKTQVIRDALDYATSNNVVMLSSAGNGAINADKYPEVPGVFGGIISIAAYDKNIKLAKFSNWGEKTVSFAFPGVDMTSSYLNNSYKSLDGTSMAVAVASASFGIIHQLAKETTDDVPTSDRLLEITCKDSTNYWKKRTKCSPVDMPELLDSLLR